MELYEEFKLYETMWEEPSSLNEADDPFLRAAIQMFQTDEDAKGVVVSITPEKQSPIKVCKLYYTDQELNNIVSNLLAKYGSHSYINAYHDRGVIEYFNKNWEKADQQAQKEAQNELNNLFFEKLQDAMKAAGLDIADQKLSKKELRAFYLEYLPENAPADEIEQTRLINVFVKALKQKLQGTTSTTEITAAEPEQKIEPKNAKLNKARQANKKIIQAFKDVGLSTDDLTVVATNKQGKEYKKASDKLNKLRKTLFGESLEDDSDIIEE